MDAITIAIIVVLCQYPLAILSLIKLFRLNLQKTPVILWNVFIIAVPFLGVLSFWIYYLIRYCRAKRKNDITEPETIISENVKCTNDKTDGETEE